MTSRRWSEQLFRFFGVGQGSKELGKFYEIALGDPGRTRRVPTCSCFPPRSVAYARTSTRSGSGSTPPLCCRYGSTTWAGTGNRREIRFLNTRLNPDLAAGLYDVKIPAGVPITNGFQRPRRLHARALRRTARFPNDETHRTRPRSRVRRARHRPRSPRVRCTTRPDPRAHRTSRFRPTSVSACRHRSATDEALLACARWPARPPMSRRPARPGDRFIDSMDTAIRAASARDRPPGRWIARRPARGEAARLDGRLTRSCRPPGTSRRAGSGDGVLSVQQRRRCGAALRAWSAPSAIRN